MRNETKARIKQILNDCCAGNASLATDILHGEFVIIPKSDLPEYKIVDLDGETHVDCGSDWGTWNLKHVAAMRKGALEYVAAWQVAEEWNSKQAVIARERDKRRDELADEFTAVSSYGGQLPYTKKLIDRIIELESAA